MEIYITRNGIQSGPFPKEQVRSMVAAGFVSREDFGWSPGQTEWRPIFEMFEDQLPPPPPSGDCAKEKKPVPPVRKVKVESPRIPFSVGRGVYFFSVFLVTIVLSTVNATLGRGASSDFSYYCVIGIMIILGIMRLRSIGYSWAIVFLGLVPIVNFVLGYMLFAYPAGYAKTKSPDFTMKLVSWIYGILLLLIILAMLVPILTK